MRWRLAAACALAGGLVWAAALSVNVWATPSLQVSTSMGANGNMTMAGLQPPGAQVFGTGAISGVVTDGVTGLPLEGVVVQLSGGAPGAPPRPQELTDARGRYIFTRLTAFPDYTITAGKIGYLDGAYRRRPGVPVLPRIAIRDGEWFQRGDVQLWKPASITGTVLDDQGDPVVGVPVRALVNVRIAGRMRPAAGPTTITDDRGVYRLSGLSPGEYLIHVPSVQVTIPDGGNTARPSTSASNTGVVWSAPDPDGLIRNNDGAGLSVGFFATPPAGGGAAAYAMAYHPAARSMDAATPVSVAYGDQRQNVDVQLTLLPTVRVSGRVLGSLDAVAKLPIRLMPVGAEGLAFGAEAAFTTTDAQGAFTFLRVPSGDYTLMAMRSVSEFSTGSGIANSPLMPRAAMSITSMSVGSIAGSNGVSLMTRGTAGPDVSGRIAVSVGDKDINDLEVPLVTGVTVSGHFLWDGADAPPAGMRLDPAARLEPADGDLSLGLRSRSTPRRQDEALPVPVTFSIEGVLPGRYVFANQTGSFSLEAIEWRGRDLLTQPLEVEADKDVTGVVIRMASKPINVTGSVSGVDGPASTGVVIAFPSSPALWRNFGLSATLFRTGTIVADGTYRLDRLVPGEYLLAAVPDEDRPKWVDPDYLASISALATRVRITPGSAVTQSLRMIGGGR